jgi:hypothetical protein
MGQTTLLAKRVGADKNCEWVYRFRADPGMPRAGILPPSPVLAPGSALGSRPRVDLSSAQVSRVYPKSGARGNSWPGRAGTDTLASPPPGLGRRHLPAPLGLDLLRSTRQHVGQALRLLAGPGLEGGDELALVDFNQGGGSVPIAESADSAKMPCPAARRPRSSPRFTEGSWRPAGRSSPPGGSS